MRAELRIKLPNCIGINHSREGDGEIHVERYIKSTSRAPLRSVPNPEIFQQNFYLKSLALSDLLVEFYGRFSLKVPVTIPKNFLTRKKNFDFFDANNFLEIRTFSKNQEISVKLQGNRTLGGSVERIHDETRSQRLIGAESSEFQTSNRTFDSFLRYCCPGRESGW